MLLISSAWTCGGKLVLIPYVHVINYRFHLFRSLSSPFSFQYILIILKSKKLHFFFPASFHLRQSAFQWHHEGISFFVGYTQLNLQDFKCPLLSYTFKNLFISYFLWSFYFFYFPPALYFETLQIFPIKFS